MDYPEGLAVRTVQLIDDQSLDQYIERMLGRPWRLQQNGMDGQDTLTYFEVFPDPEATARVAKWLTSPPARISGRVGQGAVGESVNISTADILNELCNRRLLPEGDMTVHVRW